MKRQLRKGVFETNSSSSHSLVILKNASNEKPLDKHMYLEDDGIWEIWREDDLHFGRAPFDCLTTFEEKTRYAIASLCGWRTNAAETFEDIEKVVIDTVPNCKGVKLPKEWGANDDDEVSYGYVDEDILTGFLKENNITLKEFLTNSKYIVIVDGDEYNIYEHMKECGIIDENNIEKEYY